ncbi:MULTISPECIES: hypothetical protein [unclassified Microbacterium]|uniref:hypothetical protein n=1 Tax=unclassified Microbacterium TaxID=2609290 RepID=UPI0011C40B85|nr:MULTISPECIES: hypothetical protein [unclassified Microbacterium]MBT2486727.1 hypothetical protein [Microbacterium sp. ISL-108]
MAEDAASALAMHRAQVSLEKRAAVIEVCESPVAPDHLRSISSVARAAKVSREFIHSHPELHARVAAAVASARSRRKISVDGELPTASLGVAERTTLINALTRTKEARKKLEAEVAQLRSERRRNLGAKLEAMVEPSATERLAEAALNERTQAENSRLKRELQDAKALIVQLREDLAASRLALAQALESSGHAVLVTNIRSD